MLSKRSLRDETLKNRCRIVFKLAAIDKHCQLVLSSLSSSPPVTHMHNTSGEAGNFRQGVRQSVAFLRLSRTYKNIGTSAIGFTRRPITLRNHIPENWCFLTRGAYAPYAPLVWLRHCTPPPFNSKSVRRILVRGVSAPLPFEAKKILKTWLRNGAFWSISE